MLKYAERHADDGIYDVVGHGTPNDIAGYSAQEVADRISPTLGGRVVRLLSCETGSPSGSFAQDLANNLGVTVQAPTTNIGASGSGKTLFFETGGEWKWFTPQG